MDTSPFAKNGAYLMLALDHDNSFRKMIDEHNPNGVPREKVVSLKADLIEACAPFSSGVLIDSDFGLPAYEYLKARHTTLPPFLLRVEKSGYGGDDEDRFNEVIYGGEALKNAGASGVKLLLYMNPFAAVRDRQMQTAFSVIEDAHAHGLPVFLEFVTYDIPGHKATRFELMEQSLSIFIDAGIIPDVWKLEYPGTKEECAKITARVGETPWILLSRGVTFDEFIPQLREGKEAGAKGFLVGRALWQDIGGMDETAKDEFLKTTIPERFKKFNEIFA